MSFNNDAPPPAYSATAPVTNSYGGGAGTGVRPRDGRPHPGADTAALVEMGATSSFAEWVVEEEASTAHRIYVVDNSGSTQIDDGKIQHINGTTGVMTPRGATRWEEIKQLSVQQANYNVAVGVSAEFHLLNPRNVSDTKEGVDFVVVEDSSGVAALERMLAQSGPGGGTPLAERLALIQSRLAKRAERSGSGGASRSSALGDGTIYLVIVTDGVPTPLEWSGNSKFDREDPKRRMVQQLRQITARFPVTLVVRLCTDNDADVEFWGDLDNEEEFSLDVLDDLWSEAEEVKKAGNGWLTYTPLLHTFRTAGTRVRSFDLLDERRLVAQQAAFLAEKLLLHAMHDDAVPHYADAEFMATLKERLSSAPEVQCPLSRTLKPVVDVAALEQAIANKPLMSTTALFGDGGQRSTWFVGILILIAFIIVIASQLQSTSQGGSAHSSGSRNGGYHGAYGGSYGGNYGGGGNGGYADDYNSGRR